MPRLPRPLFLLLTVLSAAACKPGGEGAAPEDAAPGRDLAVADATAMDLLPPDPGAPLPALPLRTQGRFILDAKGKRLKLAAVNWYGAEEKDYVVAGLDVAPLPELARRIRLLGYNAVRLPWSNQYLTEADIDWAYWAWNGTQARGTSRTYGEEETYGVLDSTWQQPALPALQAALAALQPAIEHP